MWIDSLPTPTHPFSLVSFFCWMNIEVNDLSELFDINMLICYQHVISV